MKVLLESLLKGADPDKAFSFWRKPFWEGEMMRRKANEN